MKQKYLLFLMPVLLFVSGCGGSPPPIQLEIDPAVTNATSVSAGIVRTALTKGEYIDPSLTVNLDIPDGSIVLQYKNPKADIVIHCTSSTQAVNAVPCLLVVERGKRTFTFTQSLTQQQQKSFQKVMIGRLYE